MGVASLVAVSGIPDPDIEAIFGKGGLLEQHGFPHRATQSQMAQTAYRALKMRRPYLVQAPTSTGKSAVLTAVGAIHSLRTGFPVVISTGNHILQEQYLAKDLPELLAILNPWFEEQSWGRRVTYAGAKGVGNYYCQAKGEELTADESWEGFAEVEAWRQTTKTGDLAELPFDVKSDRYKALRMAVTTTSEECPGKDCDWASACYHRCSKDRFREANLILTSHALLAAHLKSSFVFPDKVVSVLIDEAHALEDFVRGSLEDTVSPAALHDITKHARKLGWGYTGCRDLPVRPLEEALREAVRGVPEGEKIGSNTAISRATKSLLEPLEDLSLYLQGVDKVTPSKHCTKLLRAVSKAASGLRAFGGLEEFDEYGEPIKSNLVSWVEVRGDKSPLLTTAPVNVGGWLQATLWSKFPCVLTSATLASGSVESEAFGYIKRELGINSCWSQKLASPFDWDRQALYVFPKTAKSVADGLTEADLLPRRGETRGQTAERWARKISPIVRQLLKISRGQAFVLCTSTAIANLCYEIVGEGCPYPCRVQGDGSKSQIIDWFKSADRPILFATGGFWEGVDVELSQVIIDRIPFPNQSDPIVAAKCARCVNFMDEFYIPHAILKLTQAVGRGPRKHGSKCVMSLLDPRFAEKKYGPVIARALPGPALEGLRRTGPVSITGFLKEAL